MTQPNEKERTIDRLMQQRREKADALADLGANPYENSFKPKHTAQGIHEQFAKDIKALAGEQHGEPLSDERFSLAGRIVEYRSFGKASFVKIADRTGRIQIYVRKDVIGEEAFSVFKKTENWDHLGVQGYAFVTKTGELTVMAEQIVFLTKALRPPPEKWSGLKEQETRYRQRYVDLVVNPDVAAVFRTRSKIVSLLREFFDKREFLEVETPILHSVLGGAAAKPFATHHNALDMDLYLRIAPELYLKRLIVGGFERVYEIGRNFRNEGLSRNHNPEFTMLEFYMAYATYTDLMSLTEELFDFLFANLDLPTQLDYQGQSINFATPWKRIDVTQWVGEVCSSISESFSAKLLDDEQELRSWCQESGLAAAEDALGDALRGAKSRGEIIAALFDELGEERLPGESPVFVVGYPAETSPLARRNNDNHHLVDRFELFVAGKEISNAFSELNDPTDQRSRFLHQLENRNAGDDEAMEYDEDYCRALEYGMPPAAGQGIGIDRLVMLLCNQASIRDVILFPHLRPEAK